MNSSYSEEMNILVNDLNRESEKIINGRNLNELGIIDLRRLKHEYEAIHDLNLDLQERARMSRDVDNVELKNILASGSDLYESNRVDLVNIQEILNAKVAIGKAKLHERVEVRSAKRKNLDAIAKLKASLEEVKKQFSLNTTEETKVVYDNIIANIEKNIKELEELDKAYEDRLTLIENDLSAIRFGGTLIELENIQEETTGLTAEEAEKEVAKIKEEEKQEEVKEESKETKENEKEDIKGFINEIKTEITDAPKEIKKFINDEIRAGLDLDDKENIDKPITANEEELTQGLNIVQDNDLGAQVVGDVQSEINIPSEPIPEVEAEKNNMFAEELADLPRRRAFEGFDEPTPTVAPTIEGISNNAGSLEQLIQNGVLPSNISKEKILEVCNAVHVDANDLSFKPTSEQLERIKEDMVIQKAIFNENMVKKHQSRINEYDRLIDQYDNILNNKVDTDTFSPEYISKISSLKDKLEKERNQYQKKIDKINGESIDEHFEFNNNPTKKLSDKVANIKADILDYREELTNEKLREQYARLDVQRKEKEEHLSKKMKNKMDKRIEKTLKRIEKLQSKKAKVNANQVHIINEHSGKYIEKMTEKLNKHSARQRYVDNNIKEINDIKDRIEVLDNESKNVEIDKSNLGTSLRDKITRMSLNRESRSITKQIERLRTKQGKCDRRVQHIQFVDVNKTR